MKKIGIIILLVYIFYIVTACNYSSPKITEEEARSIVMEQHHKDIKLKSVSHKRGQYIVNWEIDTDCEFGTYYIDDQSGMVVKAEETNC